MSSPATRIDWVSRAAGPLRGEISVPGDKSISHRAIMLGSLADGESRISGFLEGEDTLATAAAFRAMGVRIETGNAGERRIFGVGVDGLAPPTTPLDFGNSGTGMRLMSGILAGQRFPSILTGDESLSRRPMRRVIEPLRAMGAAIQAEPGDTAPLRIAPTSGLRGIHYRTPVASAQVKSALLLAGLYASGATRVAEAHPTRDHTERMLAAFGCPPARDGEWTSVSGGARLRGTAIEVPGDISSAAFLIVAASVVPGSDLLLRRVGLNPLRDGLLRALRLMGADIAVENAGMAGGEPIGDIRVRHAPLAGIEVPRQLVPDMIDEFPILFVAAALARGTTVVRGAAELRVKESDRIAVMARGLHALGAEVDEWEDGVVIQGADTLAGGTADSTGDHRCAMAFCIAALRSRAPIEVLDCANVATSFPGFLESVNAAGMSVAATGDTQSGENGGSSILDVAR